MDTPETTGRSKTNFYTVTRPFLHWTLDRLTPVGLAHGEWAFEDPLTRSEEQICLAVKELPDHKGPDSLL